MRDLDVLLPHLHMEVGIRAECHLLLLGIPLLAAILPSARGVRLKP
jgi:hypothetical protein